MIIVIMSVWLVWGVLLFLMLTNLVAIYVPRLRELMYPGRLETLDVGPSGSAAIFGILWLLVTLTIAGVSGWLG